MRFIVLGVMMVVVTIGSSITGSFEGSALFAGGLAIVALLVLGLRPQA